MMTRIRQVFLPARLDRVVPQQAPPLARRGTHSAQNSHICLPRVHALLGQPCPSIPQVCRRTPSLGSPTANSFKTRSFRSRRRRSGTLSTPCRRLCARSSSCDAPSLWGFSVSLNISLIARMAKTHRPATPPPSSIHLSDLSLGPNDSISQERSGSAGRPRAPAPAPSVKPTPRPLVRPEDLPESVLWTWEDCQNDPLVGLTASNRSRPPVHKVIRHKTGTGVTPSQWKSIRASALAVTSSTLAGLTTRDPRAANVPRGKRYFKTFFPKQWEAALLELEAAASILTLCAGNWKADLVLGTVSSKAPTTAPPSCAPSPHSSSQRSQSLVPPPPPPSKSGPSRLQTQKTPAGSKSKRTRDSSPLRRPSKKAKGVNHPGESKGAPGAVAGTLRTTTLKKN